MSRIRDKYKTLPTQVRASFWFLVCTVLQRSISIITTPIFTRLLSTGEYGKYSVFISWMGILTCFVTMNIYSGVYPQSIVKFDDKKDQYSSAMQGLTMVLVIAWFLLYFFTRPLWNRWIGLNTSQMIAMTIVMWTHAIFGFWSAEQRFEYKYRLLLIVTLFEAIIQPSLCVFFIFIFNDKVNGLVWGIAVSTFISYFFLFIKQLIKEKRFFSAAIWKYALGFAIPLIPHYVSSIVLNSSDRIMIERLVGEGQAGIYNLAYTISICGTLINQAVLQTLQPWLYQKIKAKKYQDINVIAYPCLIGIAVVNLLIILFTPEIIRLFAPPTYYEAIWVMPPIALSVFFMFSYNLFSCFEFYYEKKMYVSIATMIGAALNVLLNYIFIKLFGYYAAGYTTLFCYMIFAIAHYLFMIKICKKEIPGVTIYRAKTIITISLFFLVFGFSIMLTYDYLLIRYGIATVFIILAFVLRKRIVSFIKMFFKTRKNKQESTIN